jgi:hypothetical protein
MDEIVKAAMRKWPNVPHCYGWLALDARGDWYLRDEQVQRAGPFPAVKGSRILHVKLREFIERNYGPDERGNWSFQNGPQRVYVELEAAPWIWRLSTVPKGAAPQITSHTGRTARFESAWLDPDGRLFLTTDIGPGLVHTLDMELGADAVDGGFWQPAAVRFDEYVERSGYRLRPTPD